MLFLYMTVHSFSFSYLGNLVFLLFILRYWAILPLQNALSFLSAATIGGTLSSRHSVELSETFNDGNSS